MRKVELNMNEQLKYDVIKKLVDSNGNKKRAAITLGCTVRTINRLILLYKHEGKVGFIHKNRGRKPATTFPLETKDKIISLYSSKYAGANFSHFAELLKSHEDISISDSTLRHWFFEIGILSPKVKKTTVKRLKRVLQARKKAAITKHDQSAIDASIHLLDRSMSHPRRPRCAYFGELIQMDASPFRWFDNQMTHLHLAIDDATGAVVGAYFDTQETLRAYYQVFYQILTNYGIPYKFLTDRRTIFEYKQRKSPGDENDSHTQFAYACKQLGVELECTSVPQAKGRVERLNGTLQSRLPIEIRLKGITSIEEANDFLTTYIKKFNEQFSIPLNRTKTVFERQPSNDVINRTLAILAIRQIDSGQSIRYMNKYYLPIDENGQEAFFCKGTQAMIITAFDSSLYVNIDDKLYAMKEIPQRLENSKDFDMDVQPVKQHKPYIPPMSHPWKSQSYQAFLRTRHHRSESRG